MSIGSEGLSLNYVSKRRRWFALPFLGNGYADPVFTAEKGRTGVSSSEQVVQ